MTAKYTPTDEPIKIGGIDGTKVEYYREIPTADVIHKNAKFFAFTVSTNQVAPHRDYGSVKSDWVDWMKPGWGMDSPFRKRIEMPEPQPLWDAYLYDFEPKDIGPYLQDFSVNGARAHWVPDIWTAVNGLIVTERARNVIKELDPGLSYFFPMTITITETGEPLPERRFYWKPRRTFDFWDSLGGKSLGRLTKPFSAGCAFGRLEVAWQLTNNEVLRDHLASLPFWTLEPDNSNFGMRPDVFARLKSELFTGLIEIVGDNRNAPGFDKNANIGVF
ncbi:hypothetical protein [Pontivivens insulae]|uniref:Uncharacterized protein n=1 Tax=Pontivivens insulae TaxID=1639689 RepID=A0A2R8A8T1_9RHOB|nr:hypothetical protein [Pontivivens insulae]RED18657.1 hypothetical protein DFR53_0855 [Pontivivens insulae]SPF28555.1 hypothetical protein POI8812_00856 [Pontivivens insulae]